MPRPRICPSASCGFSLAELLVVIGILVVLLSILLPAIGRVREGARQIVCASHLRDIGAAYLMYARANQGQGPAPGRAQPQFADDWIFWNRNIDDSALARYLGGTRAGVAGSLSMSLFRRSPRVSLQLQHEHRALTGLLAQSATPPDYQGAQSGGEVTLLRRRRFGRRRCILVPDWK